MKVKYVVIFLLVLMVLEGAYIASVKSRTVDEINFHLRGGYYYLTEARWDIGINNPPLMASIVALPLLFSDNIEQFNDFNKIGKEEYIAGTQRPFPKSYLFWARFMVVLFMTATAYVIYRWAQELYGQRAGLLALVLAVFSPNLLAFGTLATADMGGVFFAILSLYSFWRLMRSPTKANVLFAGISFGFAQGSKLMAVFLIPLFLFYIVLVFLLREFEVPFLRSLKDRKHTKAFHIAAVFFSVMLIGLLALNSIYLFKGTLVPLKNYNYDNFESQSFKELYGNKLINWIPLPFPERYVMGHDYARAYTADEVRVFYHFGEVKEDFPYYFIQLLLIKTPIVLFLFFTIGFIVFRTVSLSEIYMILYIVFLMLVNTLFNDLLTGYRFILSIYPLLIILAARIAKDPIGKPVKLIVLIGLGWYVLSSLWIFPHHLAYFNEFIGGPKNGWKYSIDSNLDWEQDLDYVKKYLAKSPVPILVDPGCQALDSHGRIIVPAKSLVFDKGICYQLLRENYKPIDYVGYSWMVYEPTELWVQHEGKYYLLNPLMIRG